MFKKIFLFIILYLLNNCSTDKIINHHGIHSLQQKQTVLKISESNTNDVIKILGPPSTENVFENDVWIYIERKTTVSDIRSFGRNKLLLNNVLLLEFDNMGILVKKNFYDKDTMKKLDVAQNETSTITKKQNFINLSLQSLKRKINDPLGTKTAR